MYHMQGNLLNHMQPGLYNAVGKHKGICRPKPALRDSGHPPTGLLSIGIVYTIEGTDTNGILMQNLNSIWFQTVCT